MNKSTKFLDIFLVCAALLIGFLVGVEIGWQLAGVLRDILRVVWIALTAYPPLLFVLIIAIFVQLWLRPKDL